MKELIMSTSIGFNLSLLMACMVMCPALITVSVKGILSALLSSSTVKLFSFSDNGISENPSLIGSDVAGTTVITRVSLSLEPTRFWTLKMTPN